MTALTDEQIWERFGDLFAEAIHAFRTDPEYVCQIAESAAMSKREPQAWLARWRGSARVLDTAVRDAEALALARAGYTHAGIGERLGLAKSSVSGLLQRARAREAAEADTHP